MIYEPGSPSGKEYAIPLEELRRDAGGARSGGADPLPFGIGLSRRGNGSSSGSRGRDDAAGRGQREGGAAGEGGDASGGGAASRALAERLADAEEAGAPAFWRLAPFLLVLLPGLLLGLLLSRRRGDEPAT